MALGLAATRSTLPLVALSASELAGLIHAGEVSSVEVVEQHISRIEEVNGSLNAIVVKRYEEARREARSADERKARGEPLGPLHGVPVTVKESLDLAGTPSTYGLPSRRHLPASADNAFVARLRAAGAIVLGKTNVAQMLLLLESDNPVHGRTNNPWDPQRTSGGSTGGEGAIIAAGGSPLGLGTDLGGSVRVPAAFCGIAGLKPTAGRAPDPGRLGIPFGEQAIRSEVGVMARDVEDLALGIEVINGGPDPDVDPPRPLRGWRSVDPRALRVGFYAEDGTLPVSRAVRRAVQNAVRALVGAGARVTPWHPPEVPHALDLYYRIVAADRLELVRRLAAADPKDARVARLLALARLGQSSLAIVSAVLRALGQRTLGRQLSSVGFRKTADYWRHVEMLHDYRVRFADAMGRADGGPLDLIVCPVQPLPAWTHGASRELGLGGGYTALYNALGYPAGVVPVARVRTDDRTSWPPTRDRVLRRMDQVERGSAGLPLAVQVVARPWREHVALSAMRTIEAAARTENAEYPWTPVGLHPAPETRGRDTNERSQPGPSRDLELCAAGEARAREGRRGAAHCG